VVAVNQLARPDSDPAGMRVEGSNWVHQIAAESGLVHARFCLEQEATQAGRDTLKAEFAELARMEDAALADDED